MNKILLKHLLTILTIGTILLACSNSGTKSDQDSNQESTETKKEKQSNLADNDPEVILAIIQEGTNPPSERLVESFGELLSSLKGYYSDITINEMSDKLAMAFDLAAKDGNKESLLQFVEGFRNGVQNLIRSNVRYDFTEYLASYVCYKTNCDTGNKEVLRLFSSDYVPPSNKSHFEQSRGYITNGEFLAAINQAYLDEASMYVVDSDQKALNKLIKAKAIFYLQPNIQVDLVQESSNEYDKVEFRVKGDDNTFWARREAIGEWKGKEISKQQYKELWPFTVDKGTLRCIQIKVSSMTVHPVIFEVNGKLYAINGAAKNWAKRNGYIDGDEIWNPSGSIGLIIEDGLKLCE